MSARKDLIHLFATTPCWVVIDAESKVIADKVGYCKAEECVRQQKQLGRSARIMLALESLSRAVKSYRTFRQAVQDALDYLWHDELDDADQQFVDGSSLDTHILMSLIELKNFIENTNYTIDDFIYGESGLRATPKKRSKSSSSKPPSEYDEDDEDDEDRDEGNFADFGNGIIIDMETGTPVEPVEFEE